MQLEVDHNLASFPGESYFYVLLKEICNSSKRFFIYCISCCIELISLRKEVVRFSIICLRPSENFWFNFLLTLVNSSEIFTCSFSIVSLNSFWDLNWWVTISCLKSGWDLKLFIVIGVFWNWFSVSMHFRGKTMIDPFEFSCV